MLLLTLTLLITKIILSNGEDIKDLSLLELNNLLKDTTSLNPFSVTNSDVQFFVFTRNVSDLQVWTENTTWYSNIPENNGIKFIIHGWIENHRRSWYKKLTQEFLKNGDFVVVQVDWEKASRTNYIYSAENTKSVGNIVGKFIVESSLPLDKTHLIGHSLGAHVAGFGGKKVKKETGGILARITGLDPAGPFFREVSLSSADRIGKTDARIVDVMHTDGGFYGYETPLGTLDVYFNGGTRPQPGCTDNFVQLGNFDSFGKLIENGFCSHARSVKYFTESINDGVIVCRTNVKGGGTYLISNGNAEENMKGICFASTNSFSPFLLRK